MALLSDDNDIHESFLMGYCGGNGDWYIQIIDTNRKGERYSSCVRVSTSGGNAPAEVNIAVAKLGQAMEENGLNEFPTR